MTEKKETDIKSAVQTNMTAENVKNVQAEIDTSKTEKVQEKANTDVTDEAYIYIGPTNRTGLIQNTIIKGTRKNVEEYLKEAIDEIPQIKMLIVPVEKLAHSREKMKQEGTLLNKYYNDVLSLSMKIKK